MGVEVDQALLGEALDVEVGEDVVAELEEGDHACDEGVGEVG